VLAAVLTVPLAGADVSLEDVLETLGDEVAEVRLVFASSRGTCGPPANEHRTSCLTQFEQGDSSLHYERLSPSFRQWCQ